MLISPTLSINHFKTSDCFMRIPKYFRSDNYSKQPHPSSTLTHHNTILMKSSNYRWYRTPFFNLHFLSLATFVLFISPAAIEFVNSRSSASLCLASQYNDRILLTSPLQRFLRKNTVIILSPPCPVFEQFYNWGIV